MSIVPSGSAPVSITAACRVSAVNEIGMAAVTVTVTSAGTADLRVVVHDSDSGPPAINPASAKVSSHGTGWHFQESRG